MNDEHGRFAAGLVLLDQRKRTRRDVGLYRERIGVGGI